ncbi:MAG: hypothetical protein QM736_00750 [Vicinamibacterales bacterium]
MAGGSTTRVLLGGAGGAFSPLGAPLALGVQAAVDLDGDGRLELIGIDASGRPARAASRGTTSYRWQTIRPRAATVTGDQRINSFGIGGEIEVRIRLAPAETADHVAESCTWGSGTPPAPRSRVSSGRTACCRPSSISLPIGAWPRRSD